MSIKEKGVEFTRPKGNSSEYRHKYVNHRVQSALPYRRGLNEKQNMFSLQQSPKISTGKRRRQNIMYYDLHDDITSKTINTIHKIESTVINNDKGVKTNIVLEPTEINMKRPVNSYKTKNPKDVFYYKKCPEKLKQYDKRKPIRNDKFKPKAYDQFNHRIKNFNSKYKLNSSNISNLFYKNFNQTIINNDIFGRRQIDQDNNDLNRSQKSLIQLKRSQSDIFLIKNDISSLNKTGEKYLLIPRFKDKYPINRESGSSWTTKAANPTLINYSNIDYHILNPSIKSIFKSKKKIIQNCHNNEYLTSRRQKSVGEFADLTHSSAKNVNRDFIAYFENSSRCFHNIKSVCNSMIETRDHYKLYVKKPIPQPTKGNDLFLH